MPIAFSRTMRSLEADGFGRSLGLLCAVTLVLGAALSWFWFARVAVYETTSEARLEVDAAVHPVAAEVAGRLVRTDLSLGREVRAGDVLAELGNEQQGLLRDEERTRLAAFKSRREALADQMAAQDQARPKEHQAALLAVDEARARLNQAEAAAKFAEGEAERSRQLAESKLLSQSELERIAAEAVKQRATAAAGALTVAKLGSDAEAGEKTHHAHAAQLRRELATLEGEIATSAATLKRCEHEIAQRRICAPIAGRLGEIAELRAGAFVTEGQKLAAIVPPGPLRVVAHFSPFTGLGRIRTGQPARLRLDGFPWAQYGVVAATVTSAANEPRDGRIRVELAVQAESAPLIPLQHGLTGVLEVQVERATPAALVLRSAGTLLAGPRPVVPKGPPRGDL